MILNRQTLYIYAIYDGDGDNHCDDVEIVVVLMVVMVVVEMMVGDDGGDGGCDDGRDGGCDDCGDCGDGGDGGYHDGQYGGCDGVGMRDLMIVGMVVTVVMMAGMVVVSMWPGVCG